MDVSGPVVDRLRGAGDPARAARALEDNEVIAALVELSQDRALAEALGVEAATRVQRKAAILETAAEGILVIDAEGRHLYMNPAGLQMVGWTQEELVGKPTHDMIHHSTPQGVRVPRTACPLFQVVTSGKMLRAKDDVFWRKDGTMLPVVYSSSPVMREGKIEGAVIVFSDMTERKRQEETLRFQARLLDTVGHAIIASDLQGTILYWNHEAERLYGWSSAEALGRNVVDLVPAEGHVDAANELMERYRRGESYRGEFVVKRRDGSPFRVLVVNTPILSPEGHLLGTIGVSFDITQERRREEELRELTGALENTVEGVARLDSEGWCLKVNQAYARMLGAEPEKLVGSHWMAALAAEDLPKAREAFEALRRRGKGHLEARGVRYDGTPIVIEATLVAISEGPGQMAGAYCFVRDLTARTRAAEELAAAQQRAARSEKMAALGSLVSGVAHEIRTPLTYVQNTGFLLRERVRRLEAAGKIAPEAAKELLPLAEAITDGAGRLNRLAQDLRRFLHHEPGARAEARLNEVVGEALRLYEAAHGRNVEILVELAPTDPALMDRSEIQQVIINLLNNAVEATPVGRGPIVVRTGPGDQPGTAMLSVSDAGVGIPPEVQARMFEEFFTTKPEGTGLGLSIVRSIVERHGGTIRCDSRLGVGTRFTVTLPTAATTDAE